MADNTPNGIITVKEWREHVYKKLDKIDGQIDELRTTQTAMRIELAELKVRAGIWGLMGGLVPALIVFIYWVIANA